MFEAKIAGKTYRMKSPGYGIIKRITERHIAAGDFETIDADGQDIQQPMSPKYFAAIAWSCMPRRWCGLKPFVTPGRMLDAISPRELSALIRKLSQEIRGDDGEDRDEGN